MSFLEIATVLLFLAGFAGLGFLALRHRNWHFAALSFFPLFLGGWGVLWPGDDALLLTVAVGIFLVFLIVTQMLRGRASLERSLRESENKFRSIFESAEVGLTQVRISDNTVLDANNRVAEILGYEDRLKMIADYDPKRHWVDMDVRGKILTRGLESGIGEDHEIEVFRLDGSSARVRIATTFFPEEDFFIAVSIDMTERRIAEMELRESEKKYRATFDNAQVGLIRTDMEDGRAIDANARMVEMLGYDGEAELVENFNPREANVDPVFMQKIITDIREKGVVQNVETDFYRQDGSVLQARLYSILVPEKKQIESVVIDIGEQKLMQRRLIAALDMAEEANRSKSAFLANMSHELRTPLNAILGFAQMIKDRPPGEDAIDQYREYAGFIYTSGDHLLALIGDILDLSKIEAGKAELAETEFNVVDVIDACVSLLQISADQDGLTIDVTSDPRDVVLWADERKIKQMLLNLMSNAIKFNNPGGKVDVIVKIVGDNDLSLIVADTGVGIAAEDIPKSMSVFGRVGNVLTSEKQGTGLGLPLVNLMAELHGGYLEVESEPGKGTHATIRLPGRLRKHGLTGASLSEEIVDEKSIH